MLQKRELAPGIHLVGGPSISHPTDCLVYAFIGEDKEAALIDSGAGPGFLYIRDELEKLGVHTVSHILTTHAHIDHVGGHALAQKHYQCLIVAHEAAIPVLEGKDIVMSAADLYDLPLDPCQVNTPLRGKSGQFPIADFDVHWLHIPGHTPDSVAYYIDHPQAGRILFAQDAHGPLNPRWGSDRALFKQSLRELLNLEADILCEGHFGIYSPKKRVRHYLEGQYRKF